MDTPWSPPTIIVLMPITSPAALTSGPPELPGARAASDRMIGTDRPLRVLTSPSALMIPEVADPSSPQGCPTAKTSSPILRLRLSATSAAGNA